MPDTPCPELDCVHRGEVLRTVTCTLCGSGPKQVDVYACGLQYEECTLRRTKAGTADRIRDCLGCKDRINTAGERPANAPQRLILRTGLPPGDVLTLTAAIESLHRKYRGQYLTDVRTEHPALWEHNPHITPIADDDPTAEQIDVHYPTIGRSNQTPEAFLGGYVHHLAKVLGRPLWLTTNRPHLYLSEDERAWVGQVEEQLGRRDGKPVPFWIVNAGVKSDFTAKQWPLEFYQAVVDHFAGRLQFVQIGHHADRHEPLRGVLDLVGQTDLRQLVRLTWHAAGGLGPVTLLQHLLAAWQRPYVCLVGGREPVTWCQNYPQQLTLHTIGALDCCRTEACWKSRVIPLGDGDEKDKNLCHQPVQTMARPVARCMALIRPPEVIAAIERHLMEPST